MKKVYLENLIRYEGGNNKGKINWQQNIGQYVKFTYDEISDILLIKNYNLANHHLIIEYNNIELDIYTSFFRKCQIGKLFNSGTYKYNIGDVIEGNGCQLQILTQTYLYHGKNNINREFSYLCKCLNCGYEKVIRQHSLNNHCGCLKCGDGVSYPEKFVINVLNQLNINYEVQKTFEWSNKKRYDIFIDSINTIIEVNGDQHYHNFFNTPLVENQENDKLKEQIAKNNFIKHYITIDARESNQEWIKNSIINSKLNELYNLDEINWNLADKQSYKSYVREICDLWNTGKTTTDLLSSQYHLCKTTIIKYLKIGNKLKWCIYNKHVNYINGRQKALKTFDNRKPVICITTNKIFNSQKEATEYYHIYKTGINDCCNGRIASAGKHPETGEKLIWKFINP